MANGQGRFGNALLALNTNRPPDPDRGIGIVHFDLTLPPAIAAQAALSERGARGSLDPREAARMLWAVPAAAFLDGRLDAWTDVPGVRLLRPGAELLARTPQGGWPKDQKALQAFIAQAAPAGPSAAALTKELGGAGTVDLLNDLVLIFKYAAVERERPVRAVSELYRLSRTLMAAIGPTKRDEVVAWLTAPLVVPSALTTPPGRSGPRPPAPAGPDGDGPGGGGRPFPVRPDFPLVDVSSPRATEVLGRLEHDLAEIERLDDSFAFTRALGEVEPAALARIAGAVPGDRGDAPTTVEELRERLANRRQALIDRLHLAGDRRGTGSVRTRIFGVPVVIDVGAAEARTSRLRRAKASALAASLPRALLERLERIGLPLEDLRIWSELLTTAPSSPSYLKPVGRSDLLLVRQITTGYRRAEIAYIENVLVGERRSREHTNRVLAREELFEGVERETEEMRDLQATDRAELSREVNRVVNEDLRAEGSVEVTSRGPTKVVATGAVSFERSTEEAAKSAEAYARETVERAVKRTLDRVRREARSLFEQETVEINRHGFERDPAAPDHVSGVYQYLERVSHAKIFWYGERELYDVLVPEPAALIWHLASSRKELHIPLEAPDAELFALLTVDNIADKRDDVIRAFRVTEMPPVPEETQRVPMPISATGGGDDAKHAAGKELQIPEGYVVVGATFVISADVEGPGDFTPNGGVVVGTEVALWEAPIQGDTNTGSARREFSFSPPLTGPAVAVAVNVDNFRSLSGSVTLELRLTDEARREWALEAYGLVAERYEQLRREYEQAVIQATATQPDDVRALPEGSRRRLQQIVRSELQRSVIDVMRNAAVAFDLIADHPFVNADGTLGSHPTADLPALHSAEPEVRFLQQAFEWEHLAWIIYPYFWGRRTEWSRTVVQTHADPDFAAFLNAGAARVQVPVRPGFEELVKHFMETGEVYEGAGLPKMGDPGYVVFIDEQLTTLGAPGEEIPWPVAAPREWDIIEPTSLMLVRSLAAADQLPTWDPTTGAEQ